MGVNPAGVMFHLAGFDLCQQIGDVFLIGHRHLNAHAVQSLHGWLAHTAADEKLAIADVIEFGHVRRVASHAMMVIMVVVMMMGVIPHIGQFAQLLIGDLAIVKGDNEESFGLAKMSRDGLAIVGWDCDFDSHL